MHTHGAYFAPCPRVQLVWKSALEDLSPIAAVLQGTVGISDADSALAPINVEPLIRAVLVFGDMPADVKAPFRTGHRAIFDFDGVATAPRYGAFTQAVMSQAPPTNNGYSPLLYPG
jgi:hypothetical protein